MCGHVSKKEETFALTMMASGSPTTIFLDVGYEPEFCKYIYIHIYMFVEHQNTKDPFQKSGWFPLKNHPAFEIPNLILVGTKLTVVKLCSFLW